MVELHGGLLFWSVITFLLLLGVLKKIAWGPIISALENREKEIKSALNAAKKAREEAEKVSSDYEQSMKDAQVEAQKIISDSRVTALADLLGLIGIVIVMMTLNFKLGLISMSVLPVLVFIMVIWQPIAVRAFIGVRKASAILNAYLNENITGVRVVQAMNREPKNFSIFDGVIVNLSILTLIFVNSLCFS